MNEKEFVNELGRLLNMAKPYLSKCELVKGNEIHVSDFMKDYERYMPNDDYVIVTCDNGYGHDNEKQRGWILRILDRCYSDPLDRETIKNSS